MLRSAFLFYVLYTLSQVAGATWILADHPYIQYSGRISFTNPKTPAFSWTGVSVRIRFTGPSVSIRIQDRDSRYSVVVDGVEREVLTVKADQEEYLLAKGLGAGVHDLLLTRRHESHWHKATFLGVRLAQGHSLQLPPEKPELRIEVIGDSFVSCYGCEATQREGDHQDYLRFTNVKRSFGAILANHYKADAMILAYGGKGLLRNAAKDNSGKAFPTYYERTLHVGEDMGWPPDPWVFGTWIPRLVVVHLGINDFSGDTTVPAIPEAFVNRYEQFLNHVRTRYKGTQFVLMSTNDWPFALLRPAVETVVQRQIAAGHRDVSQFHYELVPEALHWHPSVRQHQEIAAKLIEFIGRKDILR